MQHSESIANLAIALSSAQAEMPRVAFDATNDYLGNRYASLGAMIETARPILARVGLAVTQIVTSSEGCVGVETVLVHTSGEWIANTATMQIGAEKGKTAAQVAGSIITYLRRYAYAAVLGLYADEDTDGNAPAPARKPQPANQGQQAPAKQPATKPANGDRSKDETTTTYIPGSSKMSELTNKQLAAIQYGGPEKLGLHPNHFENRWKKRFGVRALKQIQVTLDEFMKTMMQEGTPEENSKPEENQEPETPRNVLEEHFGPKERIDQHLAERQSDIENQYEAA